MCLRLASLGVDLLGAAPSGQVVRRLRQRWRSRTSPLRLPAGPPYSARALTGWSGADFDLPALDSRLEAIYRGGGAPEPEFEGLIGMRTLWRGEPLWMDSLDPDAPAHREKLLERDLYLHWWKPWLPGPGERVLDLGCGVGRFATWLVDRGCDVELVDADLRSLRRAVWHCAGLSGRFDAHWTTGSRLPDLEPVDVVIAAEVLCYTADPRAVLDAIDRVLRPGGRLLVSVEARWGWAGAQDVLGGTLDALLSDGLVNVEGDRWVQTYEQSELRDLLTAYEIELVKPTHYVLSGPFEEASGCQQLEPTLDEILTLENKLRATPQLEHLHRVWLAAATKR